VPPCSDIPSYPCTLSYFVCSRWQVVTASAPMGSSLSRFVRNVLSRNKRRLLLVGLDNAGKTSACFTLVVPPATKQCVHLQLALCIVLQLCVPRCDCVSCLFLVVAFLQLSCTGCSWESLLQQYLRLALTWKLSSVTS